MRRSNRLSGGGTRGSHIARGRGTDETFHEFLKAEYNNIAQAHFSTSQSISEFFKAYIAIVSLPISAAVIFLKPEDLKKSGILSFLITAPELVLAAFGLVALAGLFVLGYVINLRCDAVLYARTVNGIRKYFYERGRLDLEEENRFRVLPTRTQTPRYWEGRYFLCVVLAFAVVGTGYWSVGLYFFYYALRRPFDVWFGLAIGLAPLVHLALYGALAEYRERRYLRSRIVGIDIDGVLNQHRTQFCKVLAERTGKALDPEIITRIPVHEIPNCGVTIEDERAVFNWPAYWTAMPEVQGVGDVVQKIRNELGYDIWIFTHRGWPQPDRYPPESVEEYRMAWEGASWWSRYALNRAVRWAERRLGNFRVPETLGSRPIWSVTRAWLKAKSIRYDKLIIERGNTDARDPLFLTRNRFIRSAQKEIRAFVEDDLNKAKRLADLCDVVFLIDQPYNRTGLAAALPNNIVRVKEWADIYQHLRRIL